MAKKAVSGGAIETKSARPPGRARPRVPRLLSFVAKLGPGIVTGAADDDPSGIATYSQVGAQFGFSMLWTMLLTYPLMAAIQEISAWIARVTGAGLAANIRRHYSSMILYPIVGLLLVANVINIGADIGAMGSAAKLILGGSACFYAMVFGLTSTIAAVAVPYKSYARILKWSTLVLFVYVATALAVHTALKPILSGTFLPSLAFSKEYLTALTAVFGTTISPYLLFWQASVEVEEQRAAPREKALKHAPHQAKAQLQPMRADTYLGMAFSNAIAFFIILDTAAVLHTSGITNIQTSAQAAEALRPLAGELAFLLFSIGIVGTGLIAVPVLAGSTAYALGECLKWRIGLEHKLQRATGFYGILAAATLIGVGLNFIGFNPIKALFWSAVINGLAAVPIMILMMLMTANTKLTGSLRLPLPQKVIGWVATGIMFTVVAAMLVTFAGEIPAR